MHEITTVHWAWAIGFGVISLVTLFGAAESLVKGKFNAPSVVLAGFLIVFASFTLSFLLACLGDFQMGSTDTLDDLHKVYKHVGYYLQF